MPPQDRPPSAPLTLAYCHDRVGALLSEAAELVTEARETARASRALHDRVRAENGRPPPYRRLPGV